MRLLFNGFQQPHLLPALREILRALELRYCATIDDERRLGPDYEVDQHDFWKVLWGDYPVAPAVLAPLDDGLIRAMAPCEATVLRMMDRLDPLHPKPYAFRKRLYLKHLQYWNDFLHRKGITHFVAANIPHEMQDYVIYELCRLKGIKTWMFCQSGIPGTTFFIDDHRDGPAHLAPAYAKVRQGAARLEDVSLVPKVEEYWQKHARAADAPAPFYMAGVKSQLKRAHSLGYVLERSLTFSRDFLKKNDGPLLEAGGNLVREGWSKLTARRALVERDKRLWDYYAEIAKAPEPGASYVYVPLHFQPECTTCPMGGTFVDQDLMIKLLSAAAPAGTMLYVKEHPVQRSQGRSVEFYDELLALPNVRLISKETPSQSLIRGAKAVATVTGTAGWEALFAGVPVMMFGYFFYQYAPGVHRVATLEDAKRAFARIAAGEKPDLLDLRCFVKAATDGAIAGFSDVAYRETAWVDDAENVRNLAGAVVARLKAS